MTSLQHSKAPLLVARSLLVSALQLCISLLVDLKTKVQLHLTMLGFKVKHVESLTYLICSFLTSCSFPSYLVFVFIQIQID